MLMYILLIGIIKQMLTNA